MRNLDPGKLSSALAENMRYLENVLNQTFNFDHAILSNIGTDDHHVAYTDAEVDTIVATHTAIGGAHHVKYTDAEVDTIVATHTAVVAAHHAKYTDAEVDARIVVAGTWTTWTPTYTNFTLGNGIVTARYVQIGDLIVAQLVITFGTTTTIDAANPRFSLPVTAIGGSVVPFGNAIFSDFGTGNLLGMVRKWSNTEGFWVVNNTAGTYATSTAINATIPFTWTNPDVLAAGFVYEAG